MGLRGHHPHSAHGVPSPRPADLSRTFPPLGKINGAPASQSWDLRSCARHSDVRRARPPDVRTPIEPGSRPCAFETETTRPFRTVKGTQVQEEDPTERATARARTLKKRPCENQSRTLKKRPCENQSHTIRRYVFHRYGKCISTRQTDLTPPDQPHDLQVTDDNAAHNHPTYARPAGGKLHPRAEFIALAVNVVCARTSLPLGASSPAEAAKPRRQIRGRLGLVRRQSRRQRR